MEDEICDHPMCIASRDIIGVLFDEVENNPILTEKLDELADVIGVVYPEAERRRRIAFLSVCDFILETDLGAELMVHDAITFMIDSRRN